MRFNPFTVPGAIFTLDDYRRYLDSIIADILTLGPDQSVRVF